MDFSFFDSLIDSVLVINGDKAVVYCNEAAATLCASSVRRMTRGKKIFEFIEFEDKELFAMENGDKGQLEALPYIEMKFIALMSKDSKEGKVQVAIQPFTSVDAEPLWVIMIRDVTLEEVLHKKYHAQLEQKEVVIQELKVAQEQLEAYSKNLEKMVEERTQEVRKANTMLSAIMNSLGQGFLVFGVDGVCGDIYTKACEEILETNPANKHIADVLKVSDAEKSTFDMWLKVSFDESLSFESLKDLGPSIYNHSEDKHITLDFFPIRVEGKISNIVLVATDRTNEYQAQKALEQEKLYAQMIVKLITSRKQIANFLSTVPNVITEVKQLANKESFDHELTFRILHTLEGEAGTYSLSEIWRHSRDVQEVLEPLKKGEISNFAEIKQEFLVELSGLEASYFEFLNKNQKLLEVIGFGNETSFEITEKDLFKIISMLEKSGLHISILNEIKDIFYKESFVANFKHYNDLVESVSSKLGKKVEPIIFTNDMLVDANAYSELFSSFVHAFRNAVDHGFEVPEERIMMGKPEAGSIEVSCSEVQYNGQVMLQITIKDDGGGINAEILRKKLMKSKDPALVESMSDLDVIQTIFESGVSSKESVGEFSGRGIGMNAIKDEAVKLGGDAWVETELGMGTKLFVRVPIFNSYLDAEQAA